MDGVLKHWPIIAALGLGGVAWGAQQQQIHALEQAVAVQTTIQAQQVQIREHGARIDERTLRTEKDVQEILRLLREMR